MTERCGACGTEGVTNSVGIFVSNSWVRAGCLKMERDALAKAIVEAAVKAGICRSDASLEGPHLLMLCEEMATALARRRKAVK